MCGVTNFKKGVHENGGPGSRERREPPMATGLIIVAATAGVVDVD